jgi:type III pantothenate kinase
MLLLFDIGNTHTHVALADEARIVRRTEIPTALWLKSKSDAALKKFVGAVAISDAALCSVVPRATPVVLRTVKKLWSRDCLVLTHKNAGIGIDYPKPETIGPDRLANAVAAKRRYGAPALVVDFGTAVTFDVIDARGKYVGGIIAPGLAAMTDYLHEKTALLPRIKIREVEAVIGKNTTEAMLIGAVHGYRGLIRGLISELKRELKRQSLQVIATGGYAQLISAKIKEITAVEPDITLEGLRLVLLASKRQ